MTDNDLKSLKARLVRKAKASQNFETPVKMRPPPNKWEVLAVSMRQSCLWEVLEPTDKMEGRGGWISCYYPSEEMAREYAKDAGVMGTPAEVRERKAYVLQEGRQVVGHVLVDNLITPDKVGLTAHEVKVQKALSKLSSEEQELLGL